MRPFAFLLPAALGLLSGTAAFAQTEKTVSMPSLLTGTNPQQFAPRLAALTLSPQQSPFVIPKKEDAPPKPLRGKWWFTFGGIAPTGVPGKDGNGATVESDAIGFSLAFGRTLLRRDSYEIGVSLRYSMYGYSLTTAGNRTQREAGILVPMVDFLARPGRKSNSLYAGIGLGLSLSILDSLPGTNSDTSFAYSLVGGYDFEKFFAEVRYLDGTASLQRGVTFSAGIRF